MFPFPDGCCPTQCQLAPSVNPLLINPDCFLSASVAAALLSNHVLFLLAKLLELTLYVTLDLVFSPSPGK